MQEITKLIASLDYTGLHKLLSENPALANQGIAFDEKNPALAHPLHRICDAVSHGILTDLQGAEIAGILLGHGSNIDGFGLIENRDTPLIAAASLNAEKTGILYLEHGANIHHAGCSGGTALHWAAWTGRENLVARLIEAGADIHKKCVEFKSTPLLWAVHGYKFNGGRNLHHQIECVRLLLDAGAEENVSNNEGKKITEFLDEGDAVLKAMLS